MVWFKDTLALITHLENLLQGGVHFLLLFIFGIESWKQRMELEIGCNKHRLKRGINAKPGWGEWREVWWQSSPGLMWHFQVCRTIPPHICIELLSIYRYSLIILKPCWLYILLMCLINVSEYFLLLTSF